MVALLDYICTYSVSRRSRPTHVPYAMQSLSLEAIHFGNALPREVPCPPQFGAASETNPMPALHDDGVDEQIRVCKRTKAQRLTAFEFDALDEGLRVGEVVAGASARQAHVVCNHSTMDDIFPAG